MRDKRPILLLTRPIDGSKRFAEAAIDRFGDRIEVVKAPLQRIEWTNSSTSAQEPSGLIFTSQNGVLGWNREENRPIARAFCVGPQTTAVAKEMGLDATDCGGSAEAIVATIASLNVPGPLIHYRGEHGVGNIAARLSETGHTVEEVVAYRQIASEVPAGFVDLFDGGRPIIAPLFSPRSVSIFQSALPEKSQPWLAVISPNAAERVDLMLQRRMMVAKAPNAAGMLNAVDEILRRISSP